MYFIFGKQDSSILNNSLQPEFSYEARPCVYGGITGPAKCQHKEMFTKKELLTTKRTQVTSADSFLNRTSDNCFDADMVKFVIFISCSKNCIRMFSEKKKKELYTYVKIFNNHNKN